MSESRASSGVRNLRAMFENGGKADDTSPPSRGRSPNGSEQTTPARPLSKVRANFVAVERSGQSAPLLGLRKQCDLSMDEVDGKMDTLHDAKSTLIRKLESMVPESTAKEVNGSTPKIHSNPVQAHVNGLKAENDLSVDIKSTDVVSKPTEDVTREGMEVDKMDSAVKDTSEDENKRESLGNILKGSAFEASPPTNRVKDDKPKAAVKNPKVQTTPSKSKPTSVPGKPIITANESVSPKKTTTPAKTNDTSKERLALKKDIPSPNKITSRPGTILTSKDTVTPNPPTKFSPAPKSPHSARKPKTPTTQGLHQLNKEVASDIPTASNESAKKPSRISNISTANTITEPKARLKGKSHNDGAKISPTSPPVKSKPKSPTRPVRLPVHATAPTASSVAKTHAAPTSRSPSRASNVPNALTRNLSTIRKDRTTAPITRTPSTTTSSIQKKSSRASLPSQNTASQDRPRSRISNATARVPDEGFLARMMRPTASSASKVYEKVEVKSPSRRSGTVKGRRKSERKDIEKERMMSLKGRQSQETKALDGDEIVSPTEGKSEVLVASGLDEEKENQHIEEEHELQSSTVVPEASSAQT
jgi:hypothetical protein